MRHNYTIEGVAYRLRPVSEADTPLIVELRGNPDHNRHMHRGPYTHAEQDAWLSEYFKRDGDYYFAMDRRSDGYTEGFISVHFIDPVEKSGEWGRWIMRPNSVGAVESAWLIYRVAFELLGLDWVAGRTNAMNQKVVSFNDSCGITKRKVLPGHFEIEGKRYDAVEHIVDREEWLRLEPRLKKLVDLTARRVGRR